VLKIKLSDLSAPQNVCVANRFKDPEEADESLKAISPV